MREELRIAKLNSANQEGLNVGHLTERRGLIKESSSPQQLDHIDETNDHAWARFSNTQNEQPNPDKAYDHFLNRDIEISVQMSHVAKKLHNHYSPLFEGLGLEPEENKALVTQLISMERNRLYILGLQEDLADSKAGYDQILRSSISPKAYENYLQHEEAQKEKHTAQGVDSLWTEYFEKKPEKSSRQALFKLFSEIGGSRLINTSQGPYSPPPSLTHDDVRPQSAAQKHLISTELSHLDGELEYIRDHLTDQDLLEKLESIYLDRISDLEENSPSNN